MTNKIQKTKQKSNTDIKVRVIRLLEILSQENGEPVSIRKFCMDNDINYVSLFNCFKSDIMGMNLANSFKKAVPNLNMNWFLYGEGSEFISE